MDYKDKAHIKIYFKATTPNVHKRYNSLPKIRKIKEKTNSKLVFHLPRKGIINISKLKNVQNACFKRTEVFQNKAKK